MTITYKSILKGKNSRLMLAILSSVLIIAVLVVYGFLTLPEMFTARKVTVTGTITASEIVLDTITFTNTGCGTKHTTNISHSGDDLGFYTISLDNGYSYNVSIAWDNGTTVNEAEVGVLFVDTHDASIVKDWIVQP